MTPTQFTSDHFSPADIAAFEPIMKIGLLATVNPQGLPHITLVSSIKATNERVFTWGQFTEGLSKQHVDQNPKVGWLVMTLTKDLWRGTGNFTHRATSGADFDAYNNVPMFRYNAYFGIHTVYYQDLVAQTGKQALPMTAVVFAAIRTMLAKPFLRQQGTQALNAWTSSLFNKLDNLKFLAYVGADGYPLIIPIIQAQAANKGHLVFSTGVFSNELKAISNGVPMAVFGLCLDMTDVLVRGVYQGLRWLGPQRCGALAVDWVYNPMPPVPQQIYPPLPLTPVSDF